LQTASQKQANLVSIKADLSIDDRLEWNAVLTVIQPRMSHIGYTISYFEKKERFDEITAEILSCADGHEYVNVTDGDGYGEPEVAFLRCVEDLEYEDGWTLEHASDEDIRNATEVLRVSSRANDRVLKSVIDQLSNAGATKKHLEHINDTFVDPSTVCERCGDEIGEDADGMGDVFGYGWCGPCTMEFALERGN
jgi:hypothetical protein